jgi:hypothetical protein
MAILKVHMIKNPYHMHSLAYLVRGKGGISSAGRTSGLSPVGFEGVLEVVPFLHHLLSA